MASKDQGQDKDRDQNKKKDRVKSPPKTTKAKEPPKNPQKPVAEAKKSDTEPFGSKSQCKPSTLSTGTSAVTTVDETDHTRHRLSSTRSSSGGSSSSVEYSVVTGFSGREYRVFNVIGKGGYGVVHKAACEMQDGNFILLAIKAENSESLDMETKVLARMRNNVHFCPLFDEGVDEVSNKRFIVMGLVGENLSNLRRTFGHFTWGTVVRVCMQALHSIEELHLTGFLSRDIKPSNFAVGHPYAMRRLVYMLDFGISRHFVDGNGVPLPRRQRTSFRGTSRYCALPQHKEADQSRRDDIESWFYMLIELTVGKLPWAGYSRHEKDKIAESKTRARTIGRRVFLQQCPAQFELIMDVVDKWEFDTVPDYDGLLVVMSRILDAINVKFGDLYDWESLERYSITPPLKMQGEKPTVIEHCIFTTKKNLRFFVESNNPPTRP